MSETSPRPSTPGSIGSVDRGSVLGSYRILGELSTGGMGTVYRAEHVLLGRPAAVKLLRPDLTTNDALVQRFVNEAKAVTACKHPGIVEVYDFDYTPDGRAFFVMELLEGEPLARRLARTRLTEPEATELAHGIASALKAAHRVGVVHRDLKPDNIFLVPDPDGGADRTKVLDFGIAKLADPSPSSRRKTQTGTLIGTPLYMAPEQARAAGAIDHRADLYSLGCILYHMLVGRPPFVAEGGGEIIALQMFGQVEPPSRLATVTPEMEQLVLRLLEKDPADRLQNAGELVLALAGLDPRLARSWPGTTRMTEAVSPSASGAGQPSVEARPAAGDTQRIGSRTPIIAGAIAVIVAAGVGLAMMMQGAGAPANLVPASSGTIAPTTSTAIAPTATAPTATAPTPAIPTSEQAAVTVSPPATGAAGRTAPAAMAIPAAPDRHPPARRVGRKRAEAAPSARPSSAHPGALPPDPPGNLLARPHPVALPTPRPGEHTKDGSPMESDVGFGKRPTPKGPAAP